MERELAVQATLYLKMDENETAEEALDRLYMYIDTDMDISVYQTEVREV